MENYSSKKLMASGPAGFWLSPHRHPTLLKIILSFRLQTGNSVNRLSSFTLPPLPFDPFDKVGEKKGGRK